jgi:predicted ribosomally synthesized peptide with nif11-like leader
MQYKEVLNSEEAADLLGVRPLTIRTYARRGVIPGKKLGNEWRFIRSDLLAWLRGQETMPEDAEGTCGGAAAFLRRAREDQDFRLQIEALTTDAERMAFVRAAGFVFTISELEEAIKAELPEGYLEDNAEDGLAVRKAQRYQVYFKVSAINGQAVMDTMILDINAWGARLGSFSPFDALGTIEITFMPPGEGEHVRLAGEVVWSRLMPEEMQYHTGVKFLKPLDQLHREGKI